MLRQLALSMILLAAPGARGTVRSASAGIDGWTRVDLPGDLQPASLTASAGELWAGGQAATGEPALARLTGGGWTSAPVTAGTTYARDADLVHVVVDGDRRPKAIGIAIGGQHLLPRWTVWAWSGTSLVEQEQTFETFGGLSAGGLTEITVTTAGPRLVGMWSPNNQYLGTALWSLHGETWTRDDNPALASTATRQQLPAAAGVLDGRLIIVGNTATFEPGGNPLSQQAIWVEGAGTWSTLLPVAPTGTSNGVLSDIACLDDGCWVVGGRTEQAGTPWMTTVYYVTAGGTPAANGDPLPTDRFDVADPPPVIAADAGHVAVLGNDGDHWWLRSSGKWTRHDRPPGVALDARIAGGVLYVVIEAEGRRALWSRHI